MRILFRSALLALCCASTAMAQSVSITGGVPAIEDFSIMAGTQNTTGTNLPTGWSFAEAGSGANTSYLIDDGTSNSGNTFSYGTAGSSDRAIGALGSGSVVTTIGARLQNDTGGSLGELLVIYTGEQWRSGTPGAPDTLNFQYCVSTCALSDTSNAANWTDFNDLDLVAPITNGTEGAKLDGNQPANRIAKSAAITGLSLGAGAQMWIRWYDVNDGGVDDALAIDDFSVGLAVDNPPQLASSVPANGANNVAVTTEIDLQFSETVTFTPASITLVCGVTTQAFTSSGSSNAYTITPNADLPFGSACTLTIPAAAVVDQDGTPESMAGPATITFNTLADTAPTLASSTPTEGSSTFPANGNLQLTFSEPVAVGSNWFTIVCATSGTRNVADTAVSGGPTSFTINPNSDFVQGESCALNFSAAQITDLDGNLDQYAGVATINFTPAAAIANALPTVLSTTPMNNATNFPAAGDIVVLFSEPVSLAAGAFSISCATTANIALSHNASGTSFTVGLDKVLVGGEACVFTIDRTKVSDGEGANPLLNTVVNFTVSSSSAGDYYDTVNDSDPEQLRCTLHEIIDGHTNRGYGWVDLEIAEEAPAGTCGPNSQDFILDVYRNRCYVKVTDRSNPVDAAHYNREHTWPKSLGFNNSALAAHNDLHMLHLSASDWNGIRDNNPYDDCSSGCNALVTDTNDGRSGTNFDGTNATGTPTFQVWDGMKGNMARAVLYMAIRYEGKADDLANDGDIPDLELTDTLSQVQITANTAAKAYMGKLSTLLQWHQQDPPDQRELDRNVAMQMIQGNRNPFVDHPEWATLALFTSAQPATCTPGSANASPIADDDNYNASEDTLLTVITANGVLVGDSDPEAAPITAVLLANALYGVVVMQNDGSFTYDPADDYCGTDTFTYRAYDGVKYSAAATVTVDVACVNDVPTAVGTLANQTYPATTAVNLATASGFDDVDNDVLGYSATGLPASLSINATSGAITGTVLLADVGVHNITVTARDPSNAEATQSFTITVTPPDAIFDDGFETATP